jgi:hypothetical protein
MKESKRIHITVLLTILMLSSITMIWLFWRFPLPTSSDGTACIRWNKRAPSEVLYVQALVRGVNTGQIDAHRQRF